MTFQEIQNIIKHNTNFPRFASFAKNNLHMPGQKRRLEEILNKEIIILDFQITKSTKRENSDCMQIQFIIDNEICVVFTGSLVLMDQINAVKNNLPLKTTVVKIDKYYSCS